MNVTKRVNKPDSEPDAAENPAAKRPEIEETEQGPSLPEALKYAISIMLLLVGVGAMHVLSFCQGRRHDGG